MIKILILGSFRDKQTALYILESFKSCAYEIGGIDIRGILQDKGPIKAQELIIQEIIDVKINPDLIIVLKGLEMTLGTLNKIKKMYPKATIVNWFFDVYLGDKPIWEKETYFDTLNFYDYYFCSLKGVADNLNDKGFKHARYLPEACHPFAHDKVYTNYYQGNKYGEDISFCGTLGLKLQHPKRVRILESIEKGGFQMKIWGDVVGSWKHISTSLKQFHKNESVANDKHSMVVQSSPINLGIDQDPTLELSHSARLYRVLCAGGLYLTTATKGIDKMFKINASDKMPTGEEDLVVFHDSDSLIKLLDFLLENEEIRVKIGKNGQKKVKEHHTFTHRAKEMLDIIKK